MRAVLRAPSPCSSARRPVSAGRPVRVGGLRPARRSRRRLEGAQRRRRLRPQPARRRVRQVRPLPGPVRQGQEGLAAQTLWGADRLRTRENSEHARTRLRGGLNWAMQGRLCPRSLAVPTMKISRRPALSEDQRLAVLGRLLTDTEIPMRLRVAGVIARLYAQPLSRVVRLTVDDIVTTATPCCYDSASQRRPSPPCCWSPSLPAATRTPPPTRRRAGSSPAVGPPAARIESPVRAPEQGRHPDRRRPRSRRPQQLLELPAPVVADALGYHDKTTSRLRNEIGGTWSRYAPGDHTRSPAGWVLREPATVEYESQPVPRPIMER